MEKFLQSINEYLTPIWKREKIVNETVMFVGEEDAGVLLYEPKEILSVKNYYLDTEYENGVDYKIEGKQIVR